MSNTISIRNVTSVNGKNLTDYKTKTFDADVDNGDVLTAGKAGTAGALGVMTMGTSHGFSNADTVAVTWATGRRYNCAISTSDSTTITVTSGEGDTLPTSGAVVVAKQVQLDVGFLGTNMEYLFAGSDVDAIITLETADAVALVMDIEAAEAYQWRTGWGDNPITGDLIEKANCYNCGTTAGNVQLFACYNND